MVRARSRSFRRTIKGWLRRSLRWWPPHHCSVPPLPPATFIGLISELRQNTPSTPLPPEQPAFLSLSLPTNTMCFLPQHNHSPTMLHTHSMFQANHIVHAPVSRSWVLVTTGPARIYVGILQHHPEYESPCYMFILLLLRHSFYFYFYFELFLLLLLLWTLELYLILSYRSLDLLIISILSWWSTILSWSLDLFIRWWSKICFFYFITYMHLTCLWLMSFIYDWHAFYTCCCATCFYHMFYMCLPWGQHMDISI